MEDLETRVLDKAVGSNQELGYLPVTMENVRNAIKFTVEEIISELEFLVSLPENDFNDGKGKYILKKYIKLLKKEI